MADTPKVTLAKWKERVQLNASSNTGTGGSEPAANADNHNITSGGPKSGITDTKGSGNPLHPDIPEEISRIRETVHVIKRQIYGGNVPGEIGLIRHVQDIEDGVIITNNNLGGRIDDLANRIGTLENRFRELMQLLEIEEDSDGQAQ